VLQTFAYYGDISLRHFVCFCRNAQSRTTASKGTVRCYFYVVIEKTEFNFKRDKDCVVLKFEEPKLGGWNCDDHIMSVEK